MADEVASPTPPSGPPPPSGAQRAVDSGPGPGALPPARSNVSSTAQRLIAEYTLTRFENNSEPDLRFIALSATRLFSTYSNSIKPIVYGNFRNVGARTVTDAADTTFLDNVVRTVATNAVVASYAVCYNKAARLDANSVARFGDYDPVDCLRFPTLTTHLVNALGPVEAHHLPYKCTFIPTIKRTDVDALLTQAGYTSHYYESFLQAMKRGRTIAMSDIDVNTRDSTHWWTLYYENIRPNNDVPGHISAYSPFSFDDRNSTSLLASVVCEDTLYDLPGPIIVHTLGPFAATRTPTSLNDLPDPFNGRLYYNRHVPAIAFKFIKHEDDVALTEAGVIHCASIQGDPDLLPHTSLYYDLGTEEPATTSTTKTGRTRKKTASTKSGKVNEGSNTDALDTLDPNDICMYTCQILYFDHKIANQVPHNRRSNIITAANALE